MKILCECLADIVILYQIPENGQVNIQCKNYDYGCDGCGFILDNKIFYNKEVVNSESE
jgi:hypothetical protein